MRQHFEGRRTRPPPLFTIPCILNLQNVPVERFEHDSYLSFFCIFNNYNLFFNKLKLFEHFKICSDSFFVCKYAYTSLLRNCCLPILVILTITDAIRFACNIQGCLGQKQSKKADNLLKIAVGHLRTLNLYILTLDYCGEKCYNNKVYLKMRNVCA